MIKFKRKKLIGNARGRTGSLLLLCTLAAVTLSLAGLAILQSHSRNLELTKSTESSVQARMTRDALAQRAIAFLRVDPMVEGEFANTELDLPDAYVKIVPISNGNGNSSSLSQVRIFLYKDATVPALVRTIDTDKLTGK